MNGQRASVEGKITSMAKTLQLCMPEILATAIIPVTHTWRYYCHFVRWGSETSLFPLLNVTGLGSVLTAIGLLGSNVKC